MSKLLKGEAAVKRAICDLLDAYHIPWWRMNAGGTLMQSKGKTYRIAGASAGTADILAAPQKPVAYCGHKVKDFDGKQITEPRFLWIEAKRPGGGKHSDVQQEFQRFVESQDHIYLLATSSDDVLAKLKELGCL